MSNPIYAFEKALYARLLGGTALIARIGGTFIYNTRAAGTPPTKRWVVFQHNVGTTQHTFTSEWESMVYWVKAVVAGPENILVAMQIWDEIDALLNGQEVDASGDGYRNFALRREGTMKFVDPDGYVNLGGLYRVYLERQ